MNETAGSSGEAEIDAGTTTTLLTRDSTTMANRLLASNITRSLTVRAEHVLQQEALILRIGDRVGVDIQTADRLAALFSQRLASKDESLDDNLLLRKLPAGVTGLLTSRPEEKQQEEEWDQFLDQVKEELRLPNRIEALNAVRGVVDVLKNMLGSADVAGLADSLPPRLRELWLAT